MTNCTYCRTNMHARAHIGAPCDLQRPPIEQTKWCNYRPVWLCRWNVLAIVKPLLS